MTTNANTTARIVAVLTLLTLCPPVLPAGSRPSKISDRPLDLEHQQLELTRGDSEPVGIADGSRPVGENDHRVFTVQQSVDLLVDTGRISTEYLSK